MTDREPTRNSHQTGLMKALDDPRLFTRWIDPRSGAESFILTGHRVAPIQQTFYYVNQSLSRDGRYYWFFCAFPPSGSQERGRTLAVVDFQAGTVTHFPDTQFTHAAPYVDVDTAEVYWCNETGVWRRSPLAGEPAVLVNRFSPDFVRGRAVDSYATHLTRSVEGDLFCLDTRMGDAVYLATAPVSGDEIEVWQELPGDPHHNHSQINPVDSKWVLFARDHRVDHVTGESKRYDNRLWLIRRGEAAFPMFPDPVPSLPGERVLHGNPDRRSRHGHEWWSEDGRYVWYIHYNRGVERVRLSEVGLGIQPKAEVMWSHDCIAHAHVDEQQRFMVLDSQRETGDRDWQVSFVDIKRQRSVDIVTSMPTADAETGRYHVHPHPRFCGGGDIICYSTRVLGRTDVAFAKVEALKAMVVT